MGLDITWEANSEALPRLHWGLDQTGLDAISRFGIVHVLTKGESIVDKGGAPDALYVVLEGQVSICRGDEEIALLSTSHSFGEMGLLLGAERRADAIARSDARVLELCQGDLDNMIQQSPVWAAMAYRAIAETLARYLSHCVDSHGD